MIVCNVSSNLVERLQMMNPKTFMDLYDDGLQVEEIENEKKKNTRNTGTRNYPTGGTQQTLVEPWKCKLSNNQGDSRTSTSLYQKS